MHRRRITALLASAALCTMACTTLAGEAATSLTTTTTISRAPSTTTTTPSSTAAASSGFVPEPVAWEGCGSGLQCATMKVPLDYTDPTGPTIELSLDELPARRPDARIGALLVNNGGPGGSGLDFVAGGRFAPDLLDRFDIVGFDPRGVGASTPLTCGRDTVPAFRHVDSTPDTPDEQAALDAAAKAVVDDCQATAGDLLPHVGTDDVVRDMDTIRQGLGEDQISFFGISYGTLLGLRFAELFPQRARAIVLDGVVDPTHGLTGWLRQQTIAFEKQIAAVFDACPDGESGCPPGGAAAAYDEVSRRVELQAIPADDGRALGPSELSEAALEPTYLQSRARTFFNGLTQALSGDGSTLLALSDAYQASVQFTLYAAVECIDSPHPVGAAAYKAFAEELEALSPRFGGGIANELLPCAFWPAPVKSVVGPVAAPGSPPILVIGTTGDAATPYQQAVDVAATLKNGRLLTYDGEGHAAYGASTCAADAEVAYFVDLTLPPEGTICTR